MEEITLKDFHDSNVELTDITVELFEDNEHPDMIGVYLSNDGSSGCEYYIKALSELGNIVSEYVTDYYYDMKDMNTYGNLTEYDDVYSCTDEDDEDD